MTRLTAHGIAWTAISQLSNQAFLFIVTAILARLLTPEDFGIVGMAAIFTGLVATVNELGLNAAIIQRKELSESHLATSFWAIMAMGILIFGIAILAAPFVARFFGKDIVAPVVILSSSGFLIGSLGVVQGSLLIKGMLFKQLAATEIGATIISGTAATVMAFAGFGVWSLALKGVIFSFASVVLLWLVCSWRPSIHFSLESFKQLFGFSVKVTGTRVVNYFQANVDYMVVGKLFGAYSLGIYSLAYRLITMPLTKISSIVTRVTFPAYSSIQDDDLRLRRGYLKEIAYISLVTFPALTGLFAVAPEFIRVIYGEKWVSAILPLRILCIVGVVKSIGTTVGSIHYSKGRADIALKWNISKFVILTGGIFAGSRYGIVGVATAIAIVTAALFPIIQWVTNRLIKLSFREYLRALYPSTSASTLMLLFLAAYRLLLHGISWQNDFFNLISSVLLGSVVYFVTLKVARMRVLDEFFAIILSTLKPVSLKR
ncbi:MAG: MOP flippase family protein [Chloroflexota bacterium]|nr:MAG: MOP flippase family protein [Chloroflexota bacterium]